MDRLPRADLPVIPHAHGNDGMVLPRHVLQSKAQEASQVVEYEIRKACDICGGYTMKVQMPLAVKMQMEMQKERGMITDHRDFQLPLRDGSVKTLCADCLFRTVEMIQKLPKAEKETVTPV